MSSGKPQPGQRTCQKEHSSCEVKWSVIKKTNMGASWAGERGRLFKPTQVCNWNDKHWLYTMHAGLGQPYMTCNTVKLGLCVYIVYIRICHKRLAFQQIFTACARKTIHCKAHLGSNPAASPTSPTQPHRRAGIWFSVKYRRWVMGLGSELMPSGKAAQAAGARRTAFLVGTSKPQAQGPDI